MKSHVRRVVAVLVIALSLQFAPIASAAVRERDDFSSKIVRVLHTIQNFFRLISLDNGYIPPIP